MYRVDLSMCIYLEQWGEGYGFRFFDYVISWVRDIFFLDWLDLGVFFNNYVVVYLYECYGFRRMGEIMDFFWVYG